MREFMALPDSFQGGWIGPQHLYTASHPLPLSLSPCPLSKPKETDNIPIGDMPLLISMTSILPLALYKLGTH